MQRQRYNWNNTFNTGDLGYTLTVSKNCVKPQRFICSDAPLIAPDDVKEFLIRQNIRTVMDLRNEKIANMSPNDLIADLLAVTILYL